MLCKEIECPACNGDGFQRFDDVEIDCSSCNCTGYVNEPVNEEQIVYVNVYSITRHYGGPEEGGWWYNWDNCIEVYPVKNKNSDLMQEQLGKDYERLKYGNIYSVLGGTDIDVRIEERPKESETRERPHYE